MKKLYIFCVPTQQNIRILKSLYLLLASGCRMTVTDGDDFAVCPIFIGLSNENSRKDTDDLEKWQQRYERARNWRFLGSEARCSIFSTRIVAAYTVPNNSRQEQETDNSLELARRLFQDDNHTYSKGLEWEQDFHSCELNPHVRITEQDRVLFILPSDNSEQTIMAKLLFAKRWVQKAEHTGIIVDFSLCDDENNKHLLGYGISLLRGVESQIFIPNTGSKNFGALVAASAIIDFSNGVYISGMITLPRGLKKDDFKYYNLNDLPNENARKHLICFHVFSNMIDGNYLIDMKDWKKHVDYQYNAEKDHLFYDNDLKPFIQLYRDWLLNISGDFFFVKSDGQKKIVFYGDEVVVLSNVIRKLNQMEQINIRLNNAERKQVITGSLVSAAYSLLNSNVFAPSHYTAPSRLYTERSQLINKPWQKLPNPFSLFLCYLWSFVYWQDYNCLRQRSYCLDMWELFFRLKKDELIRYFNIEEIIVKDIKEGHYWDVLNEYEEFHKIIGYDTGVCFFVRSRLSGRVVAYNSTYTGFCVRHDDIEPIHLGQRIFFSPLSQDWLELRRRDKDFRVFLQRYVNLMHSFAPEFVQYVAASLSAEDHVAAASANFFDSYIDYRQHVPVK